MPHTTRCFARRGSDIMRGLQRSWLLAFRKSCKATQSCLRTIFRAQEAVAHLRRALTSLEQLPRDSARMGRELSVLAALAPPLMAVYGWASTEVAEACTRAIELARQLEAHDRVYAPLWGLWTNQFVGGRLHQAMETADQVLTMALSAGDATLEVTGRHATSYTRFYRGEYDLAISEAEAGLGRFSYDRELALAQTFQLSSTVCSMTAKASAL